MAEPARREVPAEDVPEYDPRSLHRRLAFERAKREARIARRRGRKHAGLRFFTVIVVLLGLSGFLAYVVWHEIERLFGI
jgi:hypothetical protein